MRSPMLISSAESTGRGAPRTDRRRSRAAAVSVAVAAALIVLKLSVAWITGSLAVLASLVDSIADLFTSTVNLVAVRSAELPPDHDHRWGHGKAESLSSLAQATLVGGSGAFVAWQAIERIQEPASLDHPALGAAAMGVSLITGVLLSVFLRRAGRRYGSIALTADAAHYASDALTNGGALVALIAYRFFDAPWLDPIVSFAIATVLVVSAARLGKSALDQLMDRELQDDTRRRIAELVRATSPHVLGLHALKTRRAGPTLVIELHLELPATLSFAEAHGITADIESRLRLAFDDCMVMIHPEPYLAPGKPLLAGDP